MPSPLVDRRELHFLLHDLLQVQALTRAPRYAEHGRATFDAAIDTALAIAEREFLPANRSADAEEPYVREGQVVLPGATARALRAYVDAGFLAATFDESDGGMQLPRTVATACWSVFKGASIGIETYAALTIGVADLLQAHGTDAQKARWLRPLLTGECFGTMVLTEPGAGSSLADIRSTATPRADGGHTIRGQKIFITAGDHALSRNIVHLVLARLPDAPAGTRGLSLFIVPRQRADGTPNDVALAGLIHKTGCRGTTSAMLDFGARGDCRGELLGAPHQGLACMFGMMNAARINVGTTAAMLALVGYRHAVAYARERIQGRAGRDPHAPPVPIVRHADVRRMLLAQKCIAEGGLALSLYAAWLADRHEVADTEPERRDARRLLDLLTPVVKAWCARHGSESTSLAMQVLGGYGYTRDYPVEQLWRDNRLNSIHEGTDGIQALDLLGRQVVAHDGAALALLGREIAGTVAAARGLGDAAIAAHADALAAAARELHDTTRVLAAALSHTPEVALAEASVYLDMFGHTVIAWVWLRQAVLARPRTQGPDAAWLHGKLAAAHHFFRHELPRTGPQHALLRRLDPALVTLDDTWL
jgi:butyryl-CoA dehydrogenase